MSNKIQNKEAFIKNKIYSLNESEKTKVASAITEFRNRIVAKYLTD